MAAVKRLKPGQPDRFIKKPEDMTPVKFGHLNAVVDQINKALGESGDGTTVQAQLDAIVARLEALETPTP